MKAKARAGFEGNGLDGRGLSLQILHVSVNFRQPSAVAYVDDILVLIRQHE